MKVVLGTVVGAAPTRRPGLPALLALPITLAVTALAATLLTACGDAPPDVTVTRTDSAGITIVTSPADDRPIPFPYETERTLGGDDFGPASFYALGRASVGTDPLGRIHVLHADEHRVVTFERDGTFLRQVGREGKGPEELSLPVIISVSDEGQLSVMDYGKLALVRWDSAGRPLPDMAFIHRPVVWDRHHVLTDSGFVVATYGQVEDEPVQRLIEVVGQDTILMAAPVQADQDMIMFERCGGGMQFPPLFTPGIVWDHRDGITAVASGDDYRIDVWRDGRPVRSIRRPIPRAPATRDLAIAESGDGITMRFRPGEPCVVPPDEYADARGWAETVPAIKRIALGPEGGLWVQRRDPLAERGPIDRYDPDGAYLGTLPPGTPFPVLLFDDGGLATIEADELDVDRLVVWGRGEGVVK